MDWVWLFVVRRGDVLSAWCGIRPLVSDPNKKDTQSVARNHIIEVAADNLITIAGKNPPLLPSQHKMTPSLEPHYWSGSRQSVTMSGKNHYTVRIPRPYHHNIKWHPVWNHIIEVAAVNLVTYIRYESIYSKNPPPLPSQHKMPPSLEPHYWSGSCQPRHHIRYESVNGKNPPSPTLHLTSYFIE